MKMNKMKKLILLLLISLFNVSFLYADGRTLYKEGDIIFIISKSNQSKFIMYATKSVWTHCGIVIYKNNKPYVLEASNIVKLTPLDKFNKKSRGKFISHCRYTEKPIKINYSKYLGIPYDSEFSLDNNTYYCSELVWKIYKEQLGIKLCEPKPLSSYNTFGLSNILKKRKINKNSKFIAPSDLINSSKLYGV